MPNFCSTVVIWAICLLGFNSCGQKNTSKSSNLANNKFERLAESLAAWRQCEHTQGYGCATIRTSGSLVQGSFLFRDMFSRCDTIENTFQVKIINSLSGSATFRVLINIPNTEVGTFVCGSGENENNCSVRVQLHTNETGTSVSSTCTLNIKTIHPFTGELECKPLGTADGTINIDRGSTFSCAQ